MKRASTTVLAVLGLLCLNACNPKTPEPSPNAGGTSETGTSASTPKTVPDSLKHAAFKYMGFSHLEPFTWSIQNMEGVTPQEGDQAYELLEATDQAAKYQVTRTGGMEMLGSEDFEVRKDGVYQTRMSSSTLDEPMLAMPADIAVGKTWVGKFKGTDSNGRQLEFSVSNKAEKMEKVKVKAGEYDSLLVTSTGSMTVVEKGKTTKSSISSKTWYNEDLGQLKMTLEMKKEDGTNVKSKVELVKVGQKKA